MHTLYTIYLIIFIYLMSFPLFVHMRVYLFVVFSGAENIHILFQSLKTFPLSQSSSSSIPPPFFPCSLPPFILPFNSFIEISFTYHTLHLFKVYNSMVFSIFTELCHHRHNLILEYFCHPKRNSIPISNHSSPILLHTLNPLP